MKVYLAGSARNAENFHRVRKALEDAGHTVHDWTSGPAAYTWEQVGVQDTDNCSTTRMRRASVHRDLRLGLEADLQALDDCDAFVLLLPAGADAHMEMGMMLGGAIGKVGIYILAPSGVLRASQFYAMANGIFGAVEALVEELK
jgi:hypothetical protein